MENGQIPVESPAGQTQIPAIAWPIAVVGTLAIVGTIIYNAVTKYEHISTGSYLGSKTCARCHEEQARSWAQTRMARTFDVLRKGRKAKEKLIAGLDPNRDYTHDVKCIPCHTTGYGRVGGFVSEEKTPEMVGIGCEECHGAGGTYVDNPMGETDPTFRTEEAQSAGLIYPPTARVCVRCHNQESPYLGMNYKFDYEKMVKLGTHRHFQLRYDHGERIRRRR